MITTILAASLVPRGAIALEVRPVKDTFQFGDKVRVELIAVNNSDEEVVLSKSTLGGYVGGTTASSIEFMGGIAPVLNNINPSRGQTMLGRTIRVRPSEFVVIPPKGEAPIFYESIEGEWKDGYAPWSIPQGLQPLSIPARAGTYRFSFTYSFNRRKATERLNGAAYSAGYKLDEHVIPEIRRKIEYVGNSQSLFDRALEGAWSASGEVQIKPKK